MHRPQHHHFVPQFFLRNFASDWQKKKVTSVAKHGHVAVWKERSIRFLGYEDDLYVHTREGIPFSVERTINERIETPISNSATWEKINSNQTDALDRSDKSILYSLMRHLEARNPHYYTTSLELASLAASEPGMFSDEEREFYSWMRSNPAGAKHVFDQMASSVEWTHRDFVGAGMSIYRSPITLRTSSTPVLALGVPAHPALRLPLPGMVPYQLVLTLNRTTLASLVLADFDDAFQNVEISEQMAKTFNRHFVAQFAYFPHVRHLITDSDDLESDMTWAPYHVISRTERKITFRRSD